MTKPDGLAAVISALPAEPITTPARVWVKAGTYAVTVTTAAGVTVTAPVTAGVRSRAAVLIDTTAVKPPTVKPGRVDFEQEQAAEAQQTAPPPAVKRPSLIPDQYRKRTAASGPGLLEDPLAVRPPVERAPRAVWLGLRVSVGMFDDVRAAARFGP
ncbi:MAG: hypothetical protein H0X17_15885, partial [Deltaproteobacteria bacterium]|nr:hypothetical protein [Deltaproteobacteria bacterium]